jgi:hypothetical protein
MRRALGRPQHARGPPFPLGATRHVAGISTVVPSGWRGAWEEPACARKSARAQKTLRRKGGLVEGAKKNGGPSLGSLPGRGAAALLALPPSPVQTPSLSDVKRGQSVGRGRQGPVQPAPFSPLPRRSSLQHTPPRLSLTLFSGLHRILRNRASLSGWAMVDGNSVFINGERERKIHLFFCVEESTNKK